MTKKTTARPGRVPLFEACFMLASVLKHTPGVAAAGEPQSWLNNYEVRIADDLAHS